MAPEIDELYARFARISYDINYSAHIKHYGSERMFLSPLVHAPTVPSPVNLSPSLVEEQRLAQYRDA
jgi:hypothetical protein